MASILVLLVGLLAQTATPSRVVPKDFAVRLTFGSCTANQIDTAAHKYTRQIDLKMNVSATVRLTNAEMLRILDAIEAAGFFALDSEVEAPVNETSMHTIPFSTFELEVIAGGKRHKVKGDDMTDPPGPVVKRFLDLVHSILGVYENRPEVRRLPESKIGCL